jgi:cyanophycin synthetase
MFPTMVEHRCSEGCRGFSRVKRGTWMGYVIEHIALKHNISRYGYWLEEL